MRSQQAGDARAARVGMKRREHQEGVGGQVRVDHRPDQADARARASADSELRERGEEAGDEEDRAGRLQRELEAPVEPEHQQRLHDEAAAERVEAEERAQLEHDARASARSGARARAAPAGSTRRATGRGRAATSGEREQRA